MPTTPLGIAVVVIVMGAALTVSENVAVADCCCANSGTVNKKNAKNSAARFMDPDYSFANRKCSPID